MSNIIKTDEINSYDYAVLIDKYKIDTCYLGVFIDISIQKAMIRIYNISVSCDDGDFTIDLPDSYNHLIGSAPCLSFIDRKDWEYIKAEITKEILKTPWLMMHLQAKDIE